MEVLGSHILLIGMQGWVIKANSLINISCYAQMLRSPVDMVCQQETAGYA